MTQATDVRSIAADLAAIGFGNGAKTLAAAPGRKGKRVVMIEQSAQMYGAPGPNPASPTFQALRRPVR